VRHAVVRAGHGAADRHVVGIGAGQAELLPVAGDILPCRIGGAPLAGHADGRHNPQTQTSATPRTPSRLLLPRLTTGFIDPRFLLCGSERRNRPPERSVIMIPGASETESSFTPIP